MTPQQKIQEKITSLEIRILECQQEYSFDNVFDFILEDLDDIKIELGKIKTIDNEIYRRIKKSL